MSSDTAFRLQSVLNFKSSMVDNLETEFAHLKAIYETEKNTLEHLHRAVQRQTDILYQEQEQPTLNFQSIRLHQKYLDYLHENVSQQKIRLAEAQRAIETKREELVDTMKDQKTLENLRQKHQTRVTREQNQREARMVDDLVITRYAREGYSHV